MIVAEKLFIFRNKEVICERLYLPKRPTAQNRAKLVPLLDAVQGGAEEGK
jgi:hypothetical protein